MIFLQCNIMPRREYDTRRTARQYHTDTEATCLCTFREYLTPSRMPQLPFKSLGFDPTLELTPIYQQRSRRSNKLATGLDVWVKDRDAVLKFGFQNTPSVKP